MVSSWQQCVVDSLLSGVAWIHRGGEVLYHKPCGVRPSASSPPFESVRGDADSRPPQPVTDFVATHAPHVLSSGTSLFAQTTAAAPSGEVYCVDLTPVVPETVVCIYSSAPTGAAHGEHAAAPFEQLAVALQQVQKMEAFAKITAGLAHDFNNLLVGVLGGAAMVGAKLAPGSPLKEDVQRIHRAAHRAAELTQAMLTYVGPPRAPGKPEDINALLSRMVDIIRPVLAKKASIELQLDPAAARVVLDANHLSQAVANLLLRAGEGLPTDGGSISVTSSTLTSVDELRPHAVVYAMRSDGPFVAVTIEDNGKALDPDMWRSMVEPSFETQFSSRTLALASTVGIVRSHRGLLAIRSKAGQGNQFVLAFAAHGDGATDGAGTAQGERRAASVAPQRQEGAGRGLILVVDDEREIRDVAQRMLESGGYEVAVACDGSEALRVLDLERDRVRAVLLDLTMPGMSGELTLSKLRGHSRELPVVLSSGCEAEYAASEYPEIASCTFLKKPYGRAELLAAIHTAMADCGQSASKR